MIDLILSDFSSLMKPNDPVNNQPTIVLSNSRKLCLVSYMESSKVFGGAEECHSSESGWTMYIGSCIDGENDDDLGMTHENSEDGEKDGHKDYHSDDSMVSDASSGPSHHHGGERSRAHGLAVDKKAKKKPKEKQQPRAGRRKEEKKDKALLTHAKKR